MRYGVRKIAFLAKIRFYKTLNISCNKKMKAYITIWLMKYTQSEFLPQKVTGAT